MISSAAVTEVERHPLTKNAKQSSYNNLVDPFSMLFQAKTLSPFLYRLHKLPSLWRTFPLFFLGLYDRCNDWSMGSSFTARGNRTANVIPNGKQPTKWPQAHVALLAKTYDLRPSLSHHSTRIYIDSYINIYVRLSIYLQSTEEINILCLPGLTKEKLELPECRYRHCPGYHLV